MLILANEQGTISFHGHVSAVRLDGVCDGKGPLGDDSLLTGGVLMAHKKLKEPMAC